MICCSYNYIFKMLPIIYDIYNCFTDIDVCGQAVVKASDVKGH